LARDVVRIDRTLFVGIDTRTNAAGLASLACLVEPFGYAVIPGSNDQLPPPQDLCNLPWRRDRLANPAWFDGANLKDSGS
jgi:hypothetical protein